VNDADCVAFLQWALPRLGLRWSGFRRVRGQVCKRIARRFLALGLPDLAAFRARLQSEPGEWRSLDGLCRISISRFYRDRAVFDALRSDVLPPLAKAALAAGVREIRAWSAGCASGEEPFSLRLVWDLGLEGQKPSLAITATDADSSLLERAARACFPWSGVRALPRSWVEQAFVLRGAEYCLQPEHRSGIHFVRQDIREEAPDDRFHIVLCRNLAFTYFALELQQQAAERLVSHLEPGGALVLGKHEALPPGRFPLEPWVEPSHIYRKM
jgi:chemotaxis protein methyltransferase CheR